MSVKQDNIFMIGIGGAGMAPLAIYLAQSGANVSGYDDLINEEVREQLHNQGIHVMRNQEIPEGIDCVVYSNAIAKEHPLRVEAEGRGITQYRRSEYVLDFVAKDKKLIAIAGSHGKTTTTAMLINMLNDLNISFSYILGGFFRDEKLLPGNYADSQWLVAEVDESDGSIGNYRPYATVVVNLSWDHVSAYSSEEVLKSTFINLLKHTHSNIIIEESLKELVQDLDIIADVVFYNEKQSSFFTNMSSFNRLNAQAALTVCQEIFKKNLDNPLSSFSGVKRRQDVLLSEENVEVYADYAHHPREIDALLKNVEAQADGELVVVFQPHRYTRTKHLAQRFAENFKNLENFYLLPVYSSGEAYVEDGTSEAILRSIDQWGSDLSVWSDFNELTGELLKFSESKVTYLFVGAGDIDQYARYFTYCLELKRRGISFNGSVFKYLEPLSNKTTLRVGGCVRYYFEPENEAVLSNLLQFCKEKSIQRFMLGRGSNLIALDDVFEGMVIKLTQPFWQKISILSDGRIEVGAGVRLKELCGFACKEGFDGFEFLEGIPGSLGGALRMNAGAMGSWMFDVVESVCFMSDDGAILEWNKEQFDVEYRKCKQLIQGVALSAVLKVNKHSSSIEIAQKLKEYALKRKTSQPRESSAGCIFKNPKDNYAGRLIEEAGVKGESVGGAQISDVHGNFLINKGSATAKDVLGLIRNTRSVIKSRYDIDLEPEVQIIGKEWKDIL